LRDKATTEQRKSAIEAEMRTVRFDMENLRTESQKQMVAFQTEQLAQMYRELYQVVKRYATDHQIDMVLRYVEDWKDYNLSAKVADRMSMPFWPMYYDTSLEITGPVADLLNKTFGTAAAAAPPAGGGVVPASGTNK